MQNVPVNVHGLELQLSSWSYEGPHEQLVVFWVGAGGELQTYQIRTASATSSLPQTVVMASSMGLTPGKTDDPTMKREIRLAKNR